MTNNLSKDTFFVEELLRWHSSNRRDFPWRRHQNPYNVLVAEFFLQRTPAPRVAKIFEKFIEDFPSPERLSRADPAYLMTLVKPIGLVKRIQWLYETAVIITERYGGEVPSHYRDLRSLPGVGEYTASAVLCFGFGRDVAIVDVNVVRLLSRFFGIPQPPRTGNTIIKDLAERLIPPNRSISFNEAMLDISAALCRKQPICGFCPLKTNCAYFQNIHKKMISDIIA